MEAIVSLLILGILMTTIVSIIRFSTSLTSNALFTSDGMQTEFNDLITDDYPATTEKKVLFIATPAPPPPAPTPPIPPGPTPQPPFIPVFVAETGHEIIQAVTIDADAHGIAFRPRFPDIPPAPPSPPPEGGD